MIFEETFTLRQIALNAVSFTDVAGTDYVPIDCNTIVILNTSAVDVYLRSDPTNAASQITISPGMQFEIGGDRPRTKRGHRFPAGASVCSLMAASGTPNVTVECIQ